MPTSVVCLRGVVRLQWLVAAVLASVACDSSSSPKPQAAQSPTSAKPTPAAPSAAPAPRERIYVSAEQSDEVVEVDPLAARVVRRIAVGKRPRGLLAGPDGRVLYVAKSGSPRAGPGVDESKLPPADRTADGIGVVDLASGRLVRSLPGGQDPESFALARDGTALFIANEETAELSKLDLDKGEITQRVKVGEQPEGVSVHPSGSPVYVTCEQDNEVVAVDSASGRVLAHIPVGKRPRALAFSSDGALAYVTNELSASVSVIDTRTQSVTAEIPIARAGLPEQRPMGIVRSADGEHLFVSTGRGGAVAELDGPAHKLVRLIHPVGARPWGIALSPDGKRLYTANGPSNDLTIIELSSGAQKHVAIGGSPWGVIALMR